MSSLVLPTLVRRGFEAHASMTKDGDEVRVQMPVWGGLLLLSTLLVFVVAMVTVEYTFGRLIPTLIMIESPQEAIGFEPLATEDTDSTIKDPEQAQVMVEPITASFRRTLKMLGGFRARFRGFAMFIVTAFAINTIGNTLNGLPVLRFLPLLFWNIVATVICSTLSLTWTHIVISQASPKVWFRRLLPLRMWKKVALPTAVTAVAEQLSVFLPLYLAMVSGLIKDPQDLANMNGRQTTGMAFAGFGIFLFGLALSFLIVIPANVTLTRVQASLLPDSEETIVPFDRSFGGKVVPEIVGGSGVIGMLDAWKTFDWAARIRLVKAYIKVFVMEVAVVVFFVGALTAEMFIIAGNDWSKYLPHGDGDRGL